MELRKRLHHEIARDCIDPVMREIIKLSLNSADVQSRAQGIIEGTPYVRLQNSRETDELFDIQKARQTYWERCSRELRQAIGESTL